MFIRSYYNYDKDQVSQETGLVCRDETRTQQQFKEESDINVLVRRFNVTGELPQGIRMPTYDDFTEVYDFHSAANAIADARESFMDLPAEIRFNRFNNDPAAFVAFCSKEENRPEAEKLGLVPSSSPSNTVPPAPPAGPNPPAASGESTVSP